MSREFGHLYRVYVVLTVCVCWLIWTQMQRMVLGVRIAFANEQTREFADMRDKAFQSGPHDAVDYMIYVQGYYPSGTKQIAGSQLDQIVERARAAAIDAIIEHLKETTGEDYGDDPQAWVRTFPEKSAD